MPSATTSTSSMATWTKSSKGSMTEGEEGDGSQVEGRDDVLDRCKLKKRKEKAQAPHAVINLGVEAKDAAALI